MKVKEESNFHFFNIKLTHRSKRPKSELEELKKYDFNLAKKIKDKEDEIRKIKYSKVMKKFRRLNTEKENLEWKLHLKQKSLSRLLTISEQDLNFPSLIEKKKEKIADCISSSEYMISKEKIEKYSKELEAMRKEFEKQKKMLYCQRVRPPSGLYCIVGSSMLENFHVKNILWPDNFKQVNQIKKFIKKPNVFKISKNYLEKIPSSKLKILSNKGYIGPNPNFGNKFSKEFEPILIGKKKTGPGKYYYTNGRLFLAMDKSSLSSHLNPLKNENEDKLSRERIPDETQIFVWKRDDGKCVKCGTNENLAFDHIIPHSLGGSNSRRNLQLLCDSCNSRKGNQIGG